MRLVDLDPSWIEHEGRRVGVVFKCPHCQKVYLSCFVERFERFWDGGVSQNSLIQSVIGDDKACVQCKPEHQWVPNIPMQEATFETIGFTPSLDASASGHWHGHITNGLIT